MKTQFGRRQFLKLSILSASAVVTPWAISNAARAAAAKAPPSGEDPEALSVYQLGPQIWLRWKNRPLTCYRAHRSQKYPYLYPLAGPVSGLSLTDETTLPYPHHRSLFFGCDRVNGGNYWQEGLERGQILSNGPKVGAIAKNSIEIFDACDWQQPGGAPVIRDERKITVSVPGEVTRVIEWDITLKAVEDVVVSKTNHSLFSMRAALDITPKGGGNLINAQGASGEKGTFGKPSEWCCFYGKRAGGGEVVEGIAILDHPSNPWAPTPWFTRDYGFASPTPLNFMDKWELGAGKSARFRYGVVLFAGTAAQAGLQSVYRRWSGKS